MDLIFTVLLVVNLVVLIAIGIIAFRLFKIMTDDERAQFIRAVSNAIEIVIKALGDGKITVDELKEILKALVAVLAALKHEDILSVYEETGALDVIINPHDDVKVE